MPHSIDARPHARILEVRGLLIDEEDEANATWSRGEGALAFPHRTSKRALFSARCEFEKAAKFAKGAKTAKTLERK